MKPLLLALLLPTIAVAQWINYPTPGTPRLPDGKPNQSQKLLEGSIVQLQPDPELFETAAMPAPVRRQHYDLYQRRQTSDAGTVPMNMPTGDYIAYAFENIEPNSWWYPEVMQKYAGQGTPVRIEQGGRVPVNLKLIPAR
jgi:hypothetical protein